MLNIVAADGCSVFDEGGRSYLDFTSQGGLVGLGHGHPLLREAMVSQTQQLSYLHGRYEFRGVISAGGSRFEISRSALHNALREVARRAIDATSTYVNVSGSAAVMTALKLCRIAKTLRCASPAERERFIQGAEPFPKFAALAFDGVYHGNLGEAQLLTNARGSYGVGAAPGLHVARVPFPTRDMDDQARVRFLEEARRVLDQVEDTYGWRIACFVFEPISGSGDTPDPHALKSLCDEVRRRGIFLVADEFKTGQGRTGCHFACEHFDIKPDAICFSKILTGGYPCGAIAATDALALNLPAESYWDIGTFLATPMACASMLITLEIIHRERLLERAKASGEYLLRSLDELRRRSTVISDVDGRGLLTCLKVRDEVARDAIYQRALDAGLLTFPTGRGWGTPKIVLMPPLVVSEEEISRAVNILGDAVLSL